MAEPAAGGLGRRVGEAMAWNSLAAPVRAGLTLAGSVVTARLLGPHGYGAYGILNSLLTTLGRYGDLGINRSLSRFFPEAEARGGREGLTALLRDVALLKGAIALTAAAVLAAFPRLVARGVGLEGGEAWVRIIGLVFVAEVAREIGVRLLTSALRQKVTNGIDLITLAVQPPAVGLVLWAGAGLAGVLWVKLGVSLLGAALFAVGSRRELAAAPARGALADPHGVTRAMVPYAATTYFLMLTRYFSEMPFAVFVLAWTVRDGQGTAAVAEFVIAYKMSGMLMNLLSVPLQNIHVPLMARVAGADDVERLRRTLRILIKYLLFVLGPGVAFVVLGAGDLVRVFYGAVYAQAGPLLCWLIVWMGIETLFGITGNVLLVKGRYGDVVGLRLASLALAPLIVVATVAWGAAGAAFALGAGRAVIAAAAYVLAARRFALAFPFGFAARVLAASFVLAALGASAMFALPGSVLSLAALGAAGTFGFVLTFHMLGGFEEEERRMLRQLPIPGVERLIAWL